MCPIEQTSTLRRELVCRPGNFVHIVAGLSQRSNRPWRSRPRLGVGVGSAHILIDFLHQFLDAAKRPATNGLLRNPVEPDLHLVQPRGIGRSEVHVESRPRSEPAFHSWMFVPVGIASALCPWPCPVRQIAWWSRAVGSHGSLEIPKFPNNTIATYLWTLR